MPIRASRDLIADEDEEKGLRVGAAQSTGAVFERAA